MISFSRPRRVFGGLAVLGFALLCWACSSGVTSTALNRITSGMKTGEVETILGPPTRIDQSEVTGVTGKVYHYSSSQGEGIVVFVNDAVFKATFIPGGTHA